MDAAVLGYTVIYEHVSEDNWGASVPDLPGLAVGGETKEEVVRKIHDGIVFHFEGLKEGGSTCSWPNTTGLTSKHNNGSIRSKGCARSSKKGCGGLAAGRAVRIAEHPVV